MPVLGKTDAENALRFVSEYRNCTLGSISSNGLRRVTTTAVGNELENLIAKFALIAIGRDIDLVEPVYSLPVPCSFRGSQRWSCCGSPPLWICRELRRDCVATRFDAKKLRSMVATKEASEIAVCEVCPHRQAPNE